MPSVTITALAITFAGGTGAFEPARFAQSPLEIAFTGGAQTFGPNLSTDVDFGTVRLDRMQRGVSYYDNGRATVQMQQLHQKSVETIEAAFSNLGLTIAEIQKVLDAVVQAQATAAEAKQTADAVQLENLVQSSSCDAEITADSDGTITIGAHDRRYNDMTVAVNSGSVSGFAQGDFVRVYYLDAGRVGGSVTYQGTTGDVVQTGAVHVVGGVLIQVAGSPPTTGVRPNPPGYVPDPRFSDGTFR